MGSWGGPCSVPQLGRVHREPLVTMPAASGLREPGIPQKLQPVCVGLARQQLRGTLADSARVVAALISAVVQEKLEQRQEVVAQLPFQREVASQAAVEVLDHTAGPHNPIG